MADDVTLNSMSGGPVVATDDSGTGHVQIIKLAYSADGSRTPITADTNGLKVNVGNTVTVTLGSALPAGSAVIGAVTQSGTWNVTASGTVAATQSGAWTVGYSDQRSPGDSYSGSHKFVPIAAVNSSGNYSYLGINAGNGGLYVTPTNNTTWTVVERGATITDGTTTVTTTAAAITGLGLDATRRAVTIQNLGTDYIYIGTTTIAANRGIRLSPGQTLVLDKSPTPAIWAVAASGTQTISFLVEKD